MTRRPRPPDGDRGLAEATSWALLMPVVLALVLAIVSAGSWSHARLGAATAAAVAADYMAATNSQPSTGRAKATDIARRSGLAGISVHIDQDATTVTVTVTGRALMPVDIGVGAIDETAERPRERITRP